MKEVVCTIAAAALFAGPARAEAGYSVPVSVVSVNARDIGTVVLVSGFDNPLGCTNTQWFRITNDVPNGEMMRATLLTAFGTGKPVKIWVSGCAHDGVSTVLAAWANP
jgi:hypothetical protein